MNTAVAIEQVSKRFSNVQALDTVSLDIAQGEFFGLLGPNGAGKTTLISCLAGLVRPDSGHLRIMGHDVFDEYRDARKRLGVVPQELLFDPFFTVRETLRLQSGYFGINNNDDWIDEILTNLDLLGKANTNMRRLSGGMKRRVLVAQALVHKPPVIVLDEPTAGVDVELRQGLWQFVQRLNREGHTIILTTHYLEEAEQLCNRVAMLKHGHVVALDTTRNLLARSAKKALSLRLTHTENIPEDMRQCATRHNENWVFHFNHSAEVEPLLTRLRLAGIELEDMQLTTTDLEDVFIAVMRDNTENTEQPA